MLTSISNAVNGIQNNLRNFAQHSSDLSRGLVSPDNQPRRTVDQIDSDSGVDVENSRRDDHPGVEQSAAGIIADKNALQANVAVLRSSDKMIGSLLDVIG